MNIDLLSNQGEIGGGEVMLLAIAEASRELGHTVRVVAPEQPSEVIEAAKQCGFATVSIPGSSANTYLRNLRKWARGRGEKTLLWCNGLRPAFATSLLNDRVVHLHQLPGGPAQLASRIARLRAKATFVPSEFMASQISGSSSLLNWTQDSAPPRSRQAPTPGSPIVIGYLGRLSSDKGVPVFCDAVRILNQQGHDVHLLLAGESRFVPDSDAEVVKAAVEALGPTVRRSGWMDREEFFDSVDITVFPSVFPESFGLVAAEAMAARCPVVVSNAGALPEVVGPDYPYVVEAGSAEHLADVLSHAISAHASWPEILDRSRTRWATHFSPDAGRQRLQRVLQQLVDEGGSR